MTGPGNDSGTSAGSPADATSRAGGLRRGPRFGDGILLRPASLVFVTVLPLVAAISFLPAELGHYKRVLALTPDDGALRLVVLAVILSKSLFALGAGIGPLLLFARRVSTGMLRGSTLAICLIVLGYVGVDLELQRNTGNHLSEYIPYLLDPETFVWAGQGFDVVPGLLRVARTLCATMLPALAIAWLAERGVARASARVGRSVLLVLLGFFVSATTVPPFLQRSDRAAGPLHQLNERLPWTGLARLVAGPSIVGEVERAAEAVFERVRPRLASPSSLAPLLQKALPARRPDILVVVVESLRRDALDPETMPHLWSWSERGVRFDEHTATSNASHYGLFALLYGRSPLFYFETLDSGERPTLPAQLRAWGYESHHLTCSDIAWRGMERFMGSADFAVERLRGASLPACDGEVVSRAAALLSPGDRGPRFVLAFLMSTHFGYHYPDDETRFHPSIASPNALELDPDRDRVSLVNRYRNSAHAIDERLGSLLGGLDSSATLVVVTGDHGEALFDDGTIAHSSRLSDAQTRVPFVLTGPGVARGAGRRGPTDHGDVLPTLLARLGIEPGALRGYPGRDLLDETPAPFSPLVAARARRGGDDLFVLASSGPRYAWRLDGKRSALRFLGKWGQDGRPSGEPVSEQEGAEAVHWLDRYLDTLGHR